MGASLAINGCCLTVVKLAARGKFKLAQFDLLKETWQRTNLQFAKPGSLVNLERPLRTDGNLGGHFVTGHIDGIGRITRWERMGQDHVLDIAAPPEVMRYVVFKGSMAVDGISLTVAGVAEEELSHLDHPAHLRGDGPARAQDRRRGEPGSRPDRQIRGEVCHRPGATLRRRGTRRSRGAAGAAVKPARGNTTFASSAAPTSSACGLFSFAATEAGATSRTRPAATKCSSPLASLKL